MHPLDNYFFYKRNYRKRHIIFQIYGGGWLQDSHVSVSGWTSALICLTNQMQLRSHKYYVNKKY